MLKGFTRNFKPLEILTEEQVEAIHRGTLDVLRETGVRFESDWALDFFGKNGCEIDRDKKRVRFPEGLVEESLRKCPSSFRVKARSPKNDMVIGGNTVYFVPLSGMQTVNLDTWEPRLPTKKEYCDGVVILDALPNVHAVGSFIPYFGWEGISPVMILPESFAARIKITSKVTEAGSSMDSEIFAIKMMKAIGAECFVDSLLASSPLTYYGDKVECALRTAEAGFPHVIVSGCLMGGTGPATIAGSTVTNNAELIAGVVLAQLIKPRSRVLVQDYVFPQNMRSGSPGFGQIGVVLHQTIFNQIWRKYNIPTASIGSGVTSSKRADFQCGYEKAIPALTAALSGTNIINLHGGIYGELSAHPVQAILDDDIAGMMGRFIEGVNVNDETLALDLIEEVGPIPGFYLNKEHTRKWWKKEQFVPKVADMLPYPEWMKTGKKSCLDYAKEKMKEILATHDPTPLPKDQNEEIKEILKEARTYYKEKGMLQ